MEAFAGVAPIPVASAAERVADTLAADARADAARAQDPLAVDPLLTAPAESSAARQTTSIRRALVLIVLTALLPMGLFSAVLFYFLWQNQQALRDQEQLARAHTVAALVQSEVSSSVRRLEVLTHSAALANDDMPAFYKQVQGLLPDNPDWENLVLINHEAQLLNARQPFGSALPPLSPQPYQRQAFDTGKPAVSDVFLAQTRRVDTLNIAVPVMRGGKAVYLLIAPLRREYLAELLRKMVSDDGVAAVFDRNFRFISRSREHATYAGQPPGPALLAALRAGGEGVLRGATTQDGYPVFTAYTQMENGWWVVVGAPAATANRAVLQFLGLLGIIWLAALLGGLIMARLLWRRIGDSLEATAAVAARRAAGERVPFPATNFAELLGLSRAVDRLFARESSARAQAEAASQAKDEFLAMLGHELRNPIGAISNAVHILEHQERRGLSQPTAGAATGGHAKFGPAAFGQAAPGQPASPQAAAALRPAPAAGWPAGTPRPPGTDNRVLAMDVISRQSAVLKRMIDDLLDLSRVLTGKVSLELRPVELSQCVRQALEGLHTAGRTTGHSLEVITEPVWVEGDAARIEQIVNNLVVNAVNHTPAGGGIRISVARAPGRPRLDRGGAPQMAPVGDAVLVVADDGAGIAAETLPRVFDMFFQERQQVDRPKSGLGIGLTLVQRLAQLHNGDVTAESAGLGHGARFAVRLPAIPAPAPADPEPEQPRLSKRNVLLIEDNDDARETMQALLQIEGHTVEACPDGPAGIACLRGFPADVAIVDVGLPGMDGYQVARDIRTIGYRAQNGKPILLIALTGYGLPEDLKRAEEAGFDAHLVKPADFAKLAALLHEGAKG